MKVIVVEPVLHRIATDTDMSEITVGRETAVKGEHLGCTA